MESKTLIIACVVGLLLVTTDGAKDAADEGEKNAIEIIHESSILADLKVISGPRAHTKDCSTQTVVTVDFSSIRSDPCPNNILKITLRLAPERSGWLINIGDSASNNGYKGDSGTQSNDAEADGLYPNVNIWSSDKCNYNQSLNKLQTFENVFAPPAKIVTFYVSDNYIRVTNNAGFDEEFSHECFYALKGQPDATGPVNRDIYVAINRVVGSPGRNGYGVCSAKLSWSFNECRNKY